MAFRQPHFNEDEVYRLLYDIHDNEDLNDESCDRLDDNNQISSEDEEDMVKEDCEDNIDSVYDIDDMNELDDSDTDNSATETSTNEDADSHEAKNFRWSKVPPRVGRACRENIIVRLPRCQSQARNANTPLDAFSLFISDGRLKTILFHINQKIQEYLMNFKGSHQSCMHVITLDEISAVIGLLIYGEVFESSHEHLESLYKMYGTRLVFCGHGKKSSSVSIVNDEI